jgi:hypothetical protein
MTNPSSLRFYGQEQDLQQTTLVLPSPNGLGHLGSLVMDLLIQNLTMQRLGHLSSLHLHALCGGNAFGRTEEGLSTAMEGQGFIFSQ